MVPSDGDLVGVDWVSLPGRHPKDMGELVDGWVAIAAAAAAGSYRIDPPEEWVRVPTDYLVARYPNHALALVVALLAHPIPKSTRVRIAAVPLEYLLAAHGQALISQVEHLARTDECFRETTRQVHRSIIVGAVWKRVLAARGDVPTEGVFAGIDWGASPPVRLPRDMDELIDGWIANAVADQSEDTHFWAWEVARYLSEYKAALALEFVVGMLARPISDDARYGLAAGPLEDMLAYNGPAVIDEVERLARQSAVFRDTLRGVWKNAMTDDMWDRVVVARGTPASP